MSKKANPGEGQAATNVSTPTSRDKNWRAALERELADYESTGRKDRAAEVRKQLRALDGDADDKPKGRTAAKKSTAAAKASDEG